QPAKHRTGLECKSVNAVLVYSRTARRSCKFNHSVTSTVTGNIRNGCGELDFIRLGNDKRNGKDTQTGIVDGHDVAPCTEVREGTVCLRNTTVIQFIRNRIKSGLVDHLDPAFRSTETQSITLIDYNTVHFNVVDT